jgi:hypothetical protein
MGKKKNIDPYVRAYVKRRALKEPDTERGKLAHRLAQEIPRLPHTPRPVSPAISTMKKMISQARNTDPNPEDSPWHMTTLKKFPIVPEALPYVLEAWLLSLREGFPLTIREAEWVSRLYALFKGDIGTLRQVARFYAEVELLNQGPDENACIFDTPKNILNLYEKWQGKFSQEERSQLLSDPERLKAQTMADELDRFDKELEDESREWKTILAQEALAQHDPDNLQQTSDNTEEGSNTE